MKTVEDVVPNAQTYNQLITASCKVMELFFSNRSNLRQILEVGQYVLTGELLHSNVAMFVRVGIWEHAFVVVLELQISHSWCNSVDCIAGSRGQDKDILAHSRKMHWLGQNLLVSEVLWDHFKWKICVLQGGDHTGALKAYQLMQDSGFQKAITCATFNKLINSASQTEGLESAFEVRKFLQKQYENASSNTHELMYFT